MNRTALELVPTGWQPQRLRLPAGVEERAGYDGFLLGEEEILDRFATHRMYPMPLAATIDPDAAWLLAAWLSTNRGRFDPQALPWVPVGAVGPLLVLGHLDVGIQPPPLPWGLFQPVCLRREDYERQLAAAAVLLDARLTDDRCWQSAVTGGVGRFPETLVVPTDRRNALKFISEYFLHRRADFGLWCSAIEADEPADAQLPPGYPAALWFLLHNDGVVQPGAVRLSDTLQRRLPDTLRKRLLAISEVGSHLWCAAPCLPQAEAEDRLYAELGEGWTVHWLLRPQDDAPLRSVPAPATQAGAAPAKIVLPGTPALRVGREDVVEAEERLILLEEKEWGRFDPRVREASEPESLWRWAVYKALVEGATDLHLEPGPTVTRVRQRVDGLLEEILEVPSAVGEAMVYSLMTQVGLGTDKYRPCDGSFQVELIGRVSSRRQTVRVRANAYPVRGVAQKIALRFLPRQGAAPSLDLLLAGVGSRYLSRAISRPEGLILVCGPTGSGKTTTIFAALSLLNRPDLNVTTLENPVEILLEGTNQAEVNPRRDVTWETLNRAFLRQDPDVGLIGEIRDEDTARTLLRAALTGHLVFGSLHTKSCASSIVRMTDLGADAALLAETLILVVSQRLIRRVCPKCRCEHEPNESERALFTAHHLPVPAVLHRAGGASSDCDHCRGRGYRGRVAAVEVLPNTDSVRRLVEACAPAQAIAAWMKERGLQTVFENALQLAASGVTTVAEALTLQDAWEGLEWEHLA